MALGLLIARWVHTRSGKTWLWLPLVLMIAGYVVMVTMPSELKKKAGDLELMLVFEQFGEVCSEMKERFLIPMLSWAVLMALACLRRTDGKRRLVSLAFALGALAGAGVLSAATRVATRTMFPCALFLVIANGILIAELLSKPEKLLCLCLSAALCVSFFLSFSMGVADNFRTHRQWLDIKATIDHALEAGEKDVVVENLSPRTEYSAAYGLTKFSTTDPHEWPNSGAARWFGLDSLLGK
jgi:hypothetical protein